MKLASDFRNGQLALGMVYLIYANRCEANWGRALVAKECGGGVTVIGINKLLWDNAMWVEGLSVGQVGPREANVAFSVGATTAGEGPASLLFDVFGADFTLVDVVLLEPQEVEEW